jgi:serine/threonine-protein kinase
MATTLQLGLASVLYAPPEWMGPTQAVHPAIDVYAMAVLAYELLAGVHPIATEDMNAFVVCAAHASVVPPPLSALLRDLPEGLSDLLQRGMSKDPAARPSMREVADTLGRIHHRLLAPLRARARAVPLPNRPLALARTEPAMPAHPGGGTLVLPIAPASAAPVSAREVLLPAPPSVAPSTKRSASDPGAPSGVLAASEATPAAGDRRSTAVPVEGAVPRPSRPSRALPGAVAALGVVLSLNLAGAAWFVVLRPRAPAEAAPASPGSASAVPAAGTGSLADAAAPAGSTAAAPAASSAAAPPPSAVPAAKPSAASVPAAPVASAPRRKASAAPVHKAPPSLGELPDHL